MKKPYTNNTSKIQHIGCVTIMPGQTREIEESHIRAHTGAQAKDEPAKEPENKLAILLEGKVDAVVACLDALSAEDLNAVEEMEQAAEKPRKGVLKAIIEERLKRAAAEEQSKETELGQFIESLDGLSDEELLEYVELYRDDDENIAYLEAVNAEIEKRSAAGG